jgi:S1-C subfamily serine protease
VKLLVVGKKRYYPVEREYTSWGSVPGQIGNKNTRIKGGQHMSLRFGTLFSFSGLVLAALVAAGADSRSQSTSVTAPSVASLKAVEYTRQSDGEQSELVSYSELLDLINSCRAYSKGINLLPQFHEPILTRGETGIAVFRKVSPSVVLVIMANFKDDKVSETGLGTGVILDPSGYVLTNWHVVDGYQSGVIFLKPASGTEPPENSAYGLKVIALNKQADLALLKIQKPPTGLPAVKPGDISLIQVAQDIHIIGHPHGQLWSYSTGVVSQIRDNYDWKYEDGSEHQAKVLQMQTAINPGNSGGPVLDNNGNMLGLVAMSAEGQNLDYAIAIDVIRDFVSRAMAAQSRGVEASAQTPQGAHYSGRTAFGLSVTKTVYNEFVVYTVRDGKGTPIESVAEISDGATLTGLRPNAFGGFADWSYKLPNGKTFVVKSGGTGAESIVAGPQS